MALRTEPPPEALSRAEAAREAAEAKVAQPYVPLMPAWRQVGRRADRDYVRNLKLELTTMEEQVRIGLDWIELDWVLWSILSVLKIFVAYNHDLDLTRTELLARARIAYL